MKKRGSMVCAVLGLALLLLMVPEVNAQWDEMEVLKHNFDVDAGPRSQWYPWVTNNPVDNEFMVTWRSSGRLRVDCAPGDEYDCENSFHIIHGQRVSMDGVLLGDKLDWSSPAIGWAQVPRIDHNFIANEYMLAYTYGGLAGNGWNAGCEEYVATMDNMGTLINGPNKVYDRGPDGNALLPVVIYNPNDEEYLVVVTDRDVFNDYSNNAGYIFDANGNAVHGPLMVGSQAGDTWAPLGVHNPTNNTYFVVWEDFRYTNDWTLPAEVYGALLDADGNMLVEVAIKDDWGMPDMGDQRVPNVAYNPDKNEFFAVWEVKKPSLDQPGSMGSGIVGRFINADGTLSGPAFTVVDAPRIQHWPSIEYIQDEKKYFMVWTDTRNDGLPAGDPWYYSEKTDIYAGWFDDTGNQVGDDIPICDCDGNQSNGVVSYDPEKKRFLIAWYDRHAPYDWGIVNPDPDDPFGEIPSDVRATLYGIPTSAAINIGSQWANCGDVGVKIPICLINLEVEVGAVQVDLCENIDDCLICVGCEMTERTTIFDCMVNELENGCCAVVVFSKNPGGVINPGECDIVIIDYTIRDDPECCDACIQIGGENLEIVDQYGYIVNSMVGGDVGMVCPFECGDIEPAATTATNWDCGDGDVDIFDILEEVDFIIHVKDPDACQAVRADVPTGTPPDCDPPDGVIDVGDLMVIIDMALNRQDCCSYYYGGVIY